MTRDQPAPRLSAEFPDGWIETVSAPIASAVAQQIRGQLSPNRSPYMTVPEAADYLRCKPSRIYQLLSAGVIQRYKDGKRVLIRRDELEAHLVVYGAEALDHRTGSPET